MSENFKKKDYMSDQEVKWCPGCGDYAILAALQMAFAQMNVIPHKTCIVSGIGCSSRFPYYMNTYGLHTIHGRAPGFATGLKLANPDLDVWLITGDGDGLSIGGNHLAHIMRRNLDVNILLFNNEIYGLTKGQSSPTSQIGLKTKSTPYGSLDRAFDPFQFALGSGVTFFARTIDTDPKHMMETFKKAREHKGTSLIEIFQNCIIFNDKVHDQYTNRKTREDAIIRVQEGESLIYGEAKDKGLKLHGVNFKKSSSDDNDLAKHELNDFNKAYLYSRLKDPMPIGVLHQSEESETYEQSVHAQISDVKSKSNKKCFKDLLFSGETWNVK